MWLRIPWGWFRSHATRTIISVSSSPPSRSCHAVWQILDSFRSRTPRSLFYDLPWFPLSFGLQFLAIIDKLLRPFTFNYNYPVVSIVLYFVKKLDLNIIPLQTLYSFYNLSYCIKPFFSYILTPLFLLFFLHLLLSWSNFRYRIIKLEGLVCCIILFFMSLKFSVV